MFEAAVSGYLVSISLIAAIGAQNAFVLRQGIRREHVLAVVLVCAASDAVLIAAGVAGFGVVSQAVPWLGDVMRWGGVAFLLAYGALRFCSALFPRNTHRMGLRSGWRPPWGRSRFSVFWGLAGGCWARSLRARKLGWCWRLWWASRCGRLPPD